MTSRRNTVLMQYQMHSIDIQPYMKNDAKHKMWLIDICMSHDNKSLVQFTVFIYSYKATVFYHIPRQTKRSINCLRVFYEFIKHNPRRCCYECWFVSPPIQIQYQHLQYGRRVWAHAFRCCILLYPHGHGCMAHGLWTKHIRSYGPRFHDASELGLGK